MEKMVDSTMRLIDADALLDAMMQDGIWGHGKRVYDFIINAPAIEQSEQVAYMLNTGHGIVFEKEKPDCLIDKWKPLYTAPPQPQTVKDALEKAARICKEIASRDSSSQVGVISAFDCVDAIRALIEKG